MVVQSRRKQKFNSKITFNSQAVWNLIVNNNNNNRIIILNKFSLFFPITFFHFHALWLCLKGLFFAISFNVISQQSINWNLPKGEKKFRWMQQQTTEERDQLLTANFHIHKRLVCERIFSSCVYCDDNDPFLFHSLTHSLDIYFTVMKISKLKQNCGERKKQQHHNIK